MLGLVKDFVIYARPLPSSNLRLQTGGLPLHWPSPPQVSVESPSRMKPVLHVLFAVSPNVFPLSTMMPLAGGTRVGHITEWERSGHILETGE